MLVVDPRGIDSPVRLTVVDGVYVCKATLENLEIGCMGHLLLTDFSVSCDCRVTPEASRDRIHCE